MRLTIQEETHLCDWVVVQHKLGLAVPSHRQVREFAARILAVKGDAAPLGKDWVPGFVRRNPRMRTLPRRGKAAGGSGGGGGGGGGEAAAVKMQQSTVGSRKEGQQAAGAEDDDDAGKADDEKVVETTASQGKRKRSDTASETGESES